MRDIFQPIIPEKVMDVCRGEVLPVPKDVILGIKSFIGGLEIAFLFASLCHVFLHNRQHCRNDIPTYQYVLCLVCIFCSHIAAVIGGYNQTIYLDGRQDSMGIFYLPEEHLWDIFSIILLVPSVWLYNQSFKPKITWVTTALILSYLSIHHFSRTISERRIGLILLLMLLLNLVALLVHQLQNINEHPSCVRESGGFSPAAVVTVLLVFHYSLYVLQVSHIIPTEITCVCYALVAGCVRYHMSVLIGESHYSYTLPEDACSSPSDDENMQILGQKTKVIDETDSNSDVKEDDVYSVVEISEGIDTLPDVTGNNSAGVSVVPLVLEQNTLECTQQLCASHSEHNCNDSNNNNYDDDRGSNNNNSNEIDKEVTKEVDRFQLLNRLHSLSKSLDFTEEKSQREAASRRQLLRYVFHEMRAPLNAISMAVELLTNHYKSCATPRSRNTDLETLQLIEEASLTMERTLKDSMTLQKIEEGVLVPQVKIFSVHDICDDITDALSQVLKSSSVHFKYEIAEELPKQIVGDHFRIRHVVAHVLSNAIKYSKSGSTVHMSVSLRSGLADQVDLGDEQIDDEVGGGEHTTQRRPSLRAQRTSLSSIHENTPTAACMPESVVMCISDTGVGISRELQQNDIFKPFKTLKAEEIKGFRGSGLGLAICKKIMHFLHGSITYTSVPNEGTTFKVVFPLVRLDSNSMDECDSDHEDSTEQSALATATVYSSLFNQPSSISTSSTPVTPKRMLSRAKSFRGNRLLNILQTQSNVFDCPTPKSVIGANTVASRSQDPVGSEHSEYSKGGTGSAGDGSGELHPEHACSSLLASIDENENREFMSYESDCMDTTSSIAAGDICSQSAKSKQRSMPTAPPRSIAHNSSLDKAQYMRSLSIDTASPAPGMEISSSLCTSEDSLHALQEQDGENNSSALPFTLLPIHCSPPSVGASNIQARVGRTSSRDYGLGESPLRHNREYVALTEKNVNLHILRTASSDVTRALQFPRVTSSPGLKEQIPCLIGTCKVLVVDDAASNRKLLQMLLKRTGFGKVDAVDDGRAAVQYCEAAASEEDPPKIIFMDNTMPNLTGIEATKIIRAGGYKGLIIGVTGNSLEEELDEFITAGADLVIVKPLKNQTIEMLLGFIQANGFDSAHGYKIDLVGTEYTWVPHTQL